MTTAARAATTPRGQRCLSVRERSSATAVSFHTEFARNGFSSAGGTDEMSNGRIDRAAVTFVTTAQRLQTDRAGEGRESEDLMRIELVHSAEPLSEWCVELDGRMVVAFAGRSAREHAEQRVEELKRLLREVPPAGGVVEVTR
jgi:hypothetical protein